MTEQLAGLVHRTAGAARSNFLAQTRHGGGPRAARHTPAGAASASRGRRSVPAGREKSKRLDNATGPGLSVPRRS
jgi:hypothetical protein